MSKPNSDPLASSIDLQLVAAGNEEVLVSFETHLGNIEVALYVASAQISAYAFLARVDDGSFARYGAIHRVVRSGDNDRGQPPIDVIQGGLKNAPMSFPTIPHESTRATGLRHLDGTISLARGAMGTATGTAFFICVGKQPALDAGGARSADGEGFAAFGRVTDGMRIVREIHQLEASGATNDRYQAGQILNPPVLIMGTARCFRIGRLG